jgi:hypothetical protein
MRLLANGRSYAEDVSILPLKRKRARRGVVRRTGWERHGDREEPRNVAGLTIAPMGALAKNTPPASSDVTPCTSRACTRATLCNGMVAGDQVEVVRVRFSLVSASSIEATRSLNSSW